MLNSAGDLAPPNTLIMALTTFDYAALLTIAGAAAYLYSHRRDNLPLPPGPRKLPLAGNLFNMPRSFEWEKYTEWAKEFGTCGKLARFN